MKNDLYPLLPKVYVGETRNLVEAAVGRIARSAESCWHILGRRGKRLRLGCGVGGNGGGAKTGESEGDDENADEIVLHDDISPKKLLALQNFAGQTNWLQHKV